MLEDTLPSRDTLNPDRRIIATRAFLSPRCSCLGKRNECGHSLTLGGSLLMN